jgi:integrase
MPRASDISVPNTIGDRGTLAPEAAPAWPKGNFEAMARRRYQDPEPVRSGNWWYLLFWQDMFVDGKSVRKRKRHKLAPADLPEREAKKMAAEYLRPMNQGLTPISSATKFEQYVDTIYKTTVLPLFAKSTQERYSSVIKNYLKPAFGSRCMRDLTPLTLQQYFSGMTSSNLSFESRDKVRDVMSSILASAVTYGLLVTNPMEGVRLAPAKKGNRIKPFIEPTKFSALLSLIPEPYATMVHVAAFTGLRASELIGLRW